ncbi:hypothetical protein JOD43_003383 [Pullulanibacillus pueri]|nr:hypothetical protein [Pullulanibacillus pueri]
MDTLVTVFLQNLENGHQLAKGKQHQPLSPCDIAKASTSTTPKSKEHFSGNLVVDMRKAW